MKPRLLFLASIFLLLSPSVTHAINFADFIAGSGSHSLSTGEQISFSSQGGSGPGSPLRMNKGGNYEQFFIGSDGSIFRREDTSWATPNWRDVKCLNGDRAAYTLASCNRDYHQADILTDDGIRWLPPSGNPGQTLSSENFKVVPIVASLAASGLRQTCIVTNVSGYPSPCTSQTTQFVAHYQPGEFTFCTGITNPDEMIVLKVVSGPGSGDTFYFVKGMGMAGFEAPGLKAGLMGPGADPSGCTALQDCSLESTAFPAVHIQTADPSHPGEAQNPFAPHPDNYPPAQEFVTICQDSAEVSQSFDEHKDENDQTVPYTATQLQREIKQNKYSNSLAKKLSVYFKKISNPFAPKAQIQDSFKSFDSNYIAASYRMTPARQQNEFKQDFITQAKNGQIVDEQIAWDCPNGCFTLNCGKPSPDCTPVYLSQDSHPCHQKAYPYLHFTTSGSTNTRITIHNDNGDQTVDRMLPYAAVQTNTDVPQQAISAQQQKASTQICRTVPKSPTASTTNPVKFNLFKAISELIDRAKSITKTVSFDESTDPRLETGIATQKTFFAGFIPAKDNQKIETKPDSSTTGDINLKDPGGGASQDTFDTFSQYLHPARGYGGHL